jgi:hypothetical protein
MFGSIKGFIVDDFENGWEESYRDCQLNSWVEGCIDGCEEWLQKVDL